MEPNMTEPTTRDAIIDALLDDLAEVEVEALPEDMPLGGNVLASGDDAVDRAAEQELADRLDSGDVWAWACVQVAVRFDGFEADAHLGGCCYDSEADFRAGEYFDDLRREAAGEVADALLASGFYGEPGSVSHGTGLLDDLAEGFASTLDALREARIAPRSTSAPYSADEVQAVGEVDRLLGEVEGSRAALGDDWAESEIAAEQVDALADALDAWALPGFQFGAHEGDGADFGFWPID